MARATESSSTSGVRCRGRRDGRGGDRADANCIVLSFCGDNIFEDGGNVDVDVDRDESTCQTDGKVRDDNDGRSWDNGGGSCGKGSGNAGARDGNRGNGGLTSGRRGRVFWICGSTSTVKMNSDPLDFVSRSDITIEAVRC